MNRILRASASIPILIGLLTAADAAGAPKKDRPSRRAIKGCKWSKLSDSTLGFEAWIQNCDFGFRKIDLFVKGNSLYDRYSDGGEPSPLVDVIDLLPDETPEAGIKRVFAAKTDLRIASRCVMKPFKDDRPPAGVKRYTFVPDRAYGKELAARADPNEVPDPPCGDFGDAPDGVQYFETQPASGARKILFVRVGQDEPLFDEQTLKLLPAPPAKQ